MSSATDRWVRWRVPVGYPVAAVSFYLARPSVRSLIIGGAVALIGLAVRAAASGYLRKNSELAMSGPYARTRNPLYLGSVLLAAGFAIASRSWIVAALLCVYFSVFYTLTMRREGRELSALYGAAYAGYAARVPVFFPSVRAAKLGHDTFSWSQYLRNREYRAALGTIAAMALLWLLMHWRG
ncbi:MAG: methyltransferase [Candidatus Acidiferrales bacterium]|jgi:protein-S-isoprenylcysteine O-methyltransferase Ste14